MNKNFKIISKNEAAALSDDELSEVSGGVELEYSDVTYTEDGITLNFPICPYCHNQIVPGDSAHDIGFMDNGYPWTIRCKNTGKGGLF